MLRALALVCVAALALPALPALGEPQSETHTVAPARFTERNLALQGGDRVAWRIAIEPANGTAHWDIHSHDAADPQKFTTHAQGNVTGNGTVGGTFTAPSEAVYSWLLLNAFRLPLEVTITTDVNPPEASGANPLPGPGPVLLAGAALAGALLLRSPPRRPRAAATPAR